MAAASPLDGQQSKPAEPKQTQEAHPTDSPAATQQPPKDSGAAQSPAAIDSPPTPPTTAAHVIVPQPEKRATERRDDGGNESEKKMARLTWWLVVVAVAQVILFGWQLSIMQGSLRDSKSAAIAATASVELAKTTAERQLRAYVSRAGRPTVTERKTPGGVVFDFLVPFKNNGQTPARDVRVVGEVRLLQVPLPAGADLTLGPDAHPSSTTLGAGGDLISTLESEPMGEVEVEWAKSGTVFKLYLIGSVTYRDVFDKTRRLRFLEGIWWSPDGPRAVPADRHNEDD
jgi:hypothetical protein